MLPRCVHGRLVSHLALYACCNVNRRRLALGDQAVLADDTLVIAMTVSLSWLLYHTRIPPFNVAQLDMRLANADRNGGNILAKRDADSGAWTLIPIDHGYTLPDSFQDLSFDWLNWPQVRQPLHRPRSSDSYNAASSWP